MQTVMRSKGGDAVGERVAIIGAGRMGVPMAVVLAAAGYHVDLADLKVREPAERQRWSEELRAAFATAAGQMPEPAGEQLWRRVVLRAGAGPWLGRVSALFEALPEAPDVKAAALRRLEDWLPPVTSVGSTTSSLTPDELAAGLRHPERLLVTHWLYPAHLMPLVEVAPGAATSTTAVAAMSDLLRRTGKSPVLLAGTPGLVVSRLQVLIMNEAAKMADEGVAAPAELDRAIRLGLGFRFLMLGLLEFADGGGIDTLDQASRRMAAALADPRYTPPAAVADRVLRGEIGRKSGQGFYDWSRPEVRATADAAFAGYARLLRFPRQGNGRGDLPADV